MNSKQRRVYNREFTAIFNKLKKLAPWSELKQLPPINIWNPLSWEITVNKCKIQVYAHTYYYQDMDSNVEVNHEWLVDYVDNGEKHCKTYLG